MPWRSTPSGTPTRTSVTSRSFAKACRTGCCPPRGEPIEGLVLACGRTPSTPLGCGMANRVGEPGSRPVTEGSHIGRFCGCFGAVGWRDCRLTMCVGRADVQHVKALPLQHRDDLAQVGTFAGGQQEPADRHGSLCACPDKGGPEGRTDGAGNRDLVSGGCSTWVPHDWPCTASSLEQSPVASTRRTSTTSRPKFRSLPSKP